MKTQLSQPPPDRTDSDALCKKLAEMFPAEFAQWAFGVQGKVKVEKTELRREPIRADAVILSGDRDMLHAEFQTTVKSKVPAPLRLLDYYVGLKRQNPQRRVRQVLVVLKQTSEEVLDHYRDERTFHSYDVIRMWEQDPQELLQYDGLTALATLCRAESGGKLLAKVAARIQRIKSFEQRREAVNWSRVLAGLRYDKNIINRLLKEGDMLEESVIYQDIFQRGEQRGERRGMQYGEQRMLMIFLEQRFGKLSATLRRQIERMAVEGVEELGKALFGLESKDELQTWLKQYAAKSKTMN